MIDQAKIRDYQEMVVRNIRESGVHLNSVFPTEASPGPWFTYTVGCFMIDKPELIVLGLPPHYAGALLNDYYGRVRGGATFADHDRVSGFIRDYDVVFRRVRDDKSRELMTGSHRLCLEVTGHEPECLAMIWPDREGRFPWEPGCDVKIVDCQYGVWEAVN